MIAARQMDFIGKMIRGPPDQPSRNMITACCDHKRQVRWPQMTENFMMENLRLLFKDITTINIDRFGSLQDWIHEANDEAYWNQLIKRLLHPNTPLPERPETWGPLPLWQARCAHNGRCPPADDINDNDNKNSTSVNPIFDLAKFIWSRDMFFCIKLKV